MSGLLADRIESEFPHEKCREPADEHFLRHHRGKPVQLLKQRGLLMKHLIAQTAAQRDPVRFADQRQ